MDLILKILFSLLFVGFLLIAVPTGLIIFWNISHPWLHFVAKAGVHVTTGAALAVAIVMLLW